MENSAIFKFRRGVYSSSLVGAFFNFITTLLSVFTLFTPVFSLKSDLLEILGIQKASLTSQMSLYPVDFLQMDGNDLGFYSLLIMVVLACVSAILFIINLITFCSETSSKIPTNKSYTILGSLNTVVVFLIAALSLLAQFSLLEDELIKEGSAVNAAIESLFLQNGILPIAFAVIILFTLQANIVGLMKKNIITNYNFSSKKSTKENPFTPTIIAYKSKIMLSRLIDNFIAIAILLIAGSCVFFVLTKTKYLVNVDIIGLMTSPLILQASKITIICSIISSIIALLGVGLAIIGITSLFKKYARTHELAGNSCTNTLSLLAYLIVFVFIIFAIVAISYPSKQEFKEDEMQLGSIAYCIIPLLVTSLTFIGKIVLSYLFKADVLKDIDLKGAISAKIKAKKNQEKSSI